MQLYPFEKEHLTLLDRAKILAELFRKSPIQESTDSEGKTTYYKLAPYPAEWNDKAGPILSQIISLISRARTSLDILDVNIDAFHTKPDHPPLFLADGFDYEGYTRELMLAASSWNKTSVENFSKKVEAALENYTHANKERLVIRLGEDPQYTIKMDPYNYSMISLIEFAYDSKREHMTVLQRDGRLDVLPKYNRIVGWEMAGLVDGKPRDEESAAKERARLVGVLAERLPEGPEVETTKSISIRIIVEDIVEALAKVEWTKNTKRWNSYSDFSKIKEAPFSDGLSRIVNQCKEGKNPSDNHEWHFTTRLQRALTLTVRNQLFNTQRYKSFELNLNEDSKMIEAYKNDLLIDTAMIQKAGSILLDHLSGGWQKITNRNNAVVFQRDIDCDISESDDCFHIINAILLLNGVSERKSPLLKGQSGFNSKFSQSSDLDGYRRTTYHKISIAEQDFPKVTAFLGVDPAILTAKAVRHRDR